MSLRGAVAVFALGMGCGGASSALPFQPFDAGPAREEIESSADPVDASGAVDSGSDVDAGATPMAVDSGEASEPEASAVEAAADTFAGVTPDAAAMDAAPEASTDAASTCSECQIYTVTQGPYASTACLNPPFNIDRTYAVCPLSCAPQPGWAGYAMVWGDILYCIR